MVKKKVVAKKEEKINKLEVLARMLNKKEFKDMGGKIGVGIDISYEMIETPFFQLNKSIGGGVARTKHTCVSGYPGTGKTVLMLQTIAYNQSINPDFVAAIFDAEDALDQTWLERLGVDTSRLIIVQGLPKLEDYLDAYLKIAASGYVDFMLLDSIGAAPPRGEIMSKGGEARSVGDDTQGLQARKYGQFFRMVTPLVSKYKIASVFIAQVYTDINSYGGMTMVKGGNAFKHFTQLRMMTRRSRDKTITKIQMPDGIWKEIELGWDMHIRIDKTRQSATEGHEVVLPFRKGAGIVAEEAAIITAINLGIVEQNGAWFNWGDKKWQGRSTTIAHFKNESTDLKKLSEELMRAVDKETVDMETLYNGPIEGAPQQDPKE